MKKLDKNDAKQIAELIKIGISEQELEKYSSQLNTVLDAVEVLQELDTEKIIETAQTHGLTNVFAEDQPEEGLDMKKYPNRKNFNGKYFVVKRVL